MQTNYKEKSMIPSDHFTRFYNEVFKFLEDQREEHLEAYWLEISKNQEKHTLELFKEKGVIVARRTVAKYREMLQIPSSAERKRLMRLNKVININFKKFIRPEKKFRNLKYLKKQIKLDIKQAKK